MSKNVKITKPNHVYEQLKHEILYLEYTPGQIIGEVEIANRFKVSRTPVRDAFKRLEVEGLVEVVSHVGTFVTLIDLDQITDVMYMREKIELGIIQDLSTSIKQNQIIKITLNLQKQKELLESALSEKEMAQEFIKLDNEFHRSLFEIAGKGSIWHHLEAIEHHYDRLRLFLNFGERSRLMKLYDEHTEIFDCILNQKMDYARDVFSTHLYYGVQSGTEMILKNIQYFSSISDEGKKREYSKK